MRDCERCTVIECAFGSRDPLPPRIVSLDEDPTQSLAREVDNTSSRDEHDADTKSLASSGTATSALQPSGSTISSTCNSTFVNPLERAAAGLSATSSNVPTDGPNAHVERSDMAASGSEAFQPKATADDPEIATPSTILVKILKNVDVLDALMLNCPDFPTLFALVASCKAAKLNFENHSQGIIKGVLRKMPQELRYLTVALIEIDGSKIDQSESIKKLMRTWLRTEPKPSTKRLQVSLTGTTSLLHSSQPALHAFLGHQSLPSLSF